MAPPIWAGNNPTSDHPQDYVFFLAKEDVPYGCFSNAYRESAGGHMGLSESFGGGSSTSSDSKFWCVNQELHYRKAKIFGDHDTAQQILDEKDDAGKIKQLGRMVKGYDDDKWTELRYDVARDAVYAKFSSDGALKKILLETGDKVIVEAASDKAWGIGCLEFSTEDKRGAKNREADAWDVAPEFWEGQNLLGRCLMDVRKMIRESQE
ncbi:hypothetical protein HJC23_001179 [Cyclotella cryptica]|uniref:NADAR domain-containing protein n=1 Tax=Cyclotella cryptica TaxID=29204 RepID=A0ABD3QMY5_9STRA|eukprot:CCRYP_003810-RA/>CCRYP_003810-RA protein AED:0.01 eAED:-0.01 QI:0/-1/0/1/-1/1/1/0/207